MRRDLKKKGTPEGPESRSGGPRRGRGAQHTRARRGLCAPSDPTRVLGARRRRAPKKLLKIDQRSGRRHQSQPADPSKHYVAFRAPHRTRPVFFFSRCLGARRRREQRIRSRSEGSLKMRLTETSSDARLRFNLAPRRSPSVCAEFFFKK